MLKPDYEVFWALHDDVREMAVELDRYQRTLDLDASSQWTLEECALAVEQILALVPGPEVEFEHSEDRRVAMRTAVGLVGHALNELEAAAVIILTEIPEVQIPYRRAHAAGLELYNVLDALDVKPHRRPHA